MNNFYKVIQDPDVRQAFKTMLAEVIMESNLAGNNSDGKDRYLHGVDALAEYLGISYPAAHRLKKGPLSPAVWQEGRVILIDKVMVKKIMEGQSFNVE